MKNRPHGSHSDSHLQCKFLGTCLFTVHCPSLANATPSRNRGKVESRGFRDANRVSNFRYVIFYCFFSITNIYMHSGYLYRMKTTTWRHSHQHQHQHGQRQTNGVTLASSRNTQKGLNDDMYNFPPHCTRNIVYLKM